MHARSVCLFHGLGILDIGSKYCSTLQVLDQEVVLS